MRTLNHNSAFTKLKPEEIFYNSIAEKYDEGYSYNLAIAENEFIINFIIRNRLADGNILDLGCGTGLLLDYINKKNTEYSGIDISERMLEVMSKKHPHACTSKMDIKDIGCMFPESGFDNVLSLFGSFTYVKEQEAAIEGMYRVLKPGGKFFLMLSSESFTKRKNYVGNKFKNEMELVCYSKKRVEQLFSKFKNIKARGFNLLAEKLPGKLPVSFYSGFLKLESLLLGTTFPYRHYYILLTGEKPLK